METYTINTIQDEMNAAGSHWWDRGSMRSFGTRAGQKVYQGEGGVYFVTSEQPPHRKRAFSVRQYDPATTSINTVGEFCSMTRAVAHRQAAELAGPAAVVVEEAHEPVSEAEQLAIDIERGGGRGNDGSAAWLIRLATKYQKMCIDACNHPGCEMYDADGETMPRVAKLEKALSGAAEEHNCKIKFGGDPRGCTAKLILPNGDTNDFGGEGWCIPTR